MNIQDVIDFVNAKSSEGHEIKRQRVAQEVDKLTAGHALMTRLRQGLSRFDELDYYARSKDQVLMHNLMLSALAKLLYGPETFDRFKRAIAKFNGFKSLDWFLACMLPRREGKSISLEQLIATLLALCPGIKIAFIVNNLKNAESSCAKIKDFLRIVYGKEDKSDLPTDRARSIKVSHPDGNISSFMAFSGQGNPNK